jgi:hypothetical protein
MARGIVMLFFQKLKMLSSKTKSCFLALLEKAKNKKGYHMIALPMGLIISRNN